jgi:RNA polymerase sigma factor (sigma-70 family)
MNQAMISPVDDSIPTRYTLLSRLQDWDDQESWRVFFDTYWRLIYSVAIRAGLTEAEAQDVVQETIICVAKDIEKFKRDRSAGSFKGWLRNLTRWRIADQLRKRGRADLKVLVFSEEHAEVLQDPANGGLEEIWEKEWRTNLLEAATERVRRQVKEEHYQIFDLNVIKQWPAQKVARVLGVNVGLVYLAKHRVSALIRKEVRLLERELH